MSKTPGYAEGGWYLITKMFKKLGFMTIRCLFQNAVNRDFSKKIRKLKKNGRQMRGSVVHQIRQVLEPLARFGESKHAAKAGKNSHTFASQNGLYSYRTYNCYFDIIKDCLTYLKEQDITKDIMKVTPAHISEWVETKIEQGITAKTLANYACAVQKLGLGIDCIREKSGVTPKEGAERTSELFRQAVLSTTKDDLKETAGRDAYPRPQELLQATTWQKSEEGLKAQVVAQISYIYANRVSEASHIPIHNEPFSPEKHRGIVGLFADSVAQTRNKGGQYQVKEYSADIADKVRQLAQGGVFHVDQTTARRYIEAAAKETGQYKSGRGFHALRHNCSQELRAALLQQGYSEQEAKKIASEYLSHHRPDATDHYEPKK